MLSNVTWGQFIEVMVILFIIYYAYIGLKYYRAEIGDFFGKLRGQTDSHNGFAFTTQETSDHDFEELKAVTEDLQGAILQRAGKRVGKEELLERLQERLSLYSGLHKPALRAAINNYIISNSKEICGVIFSEYELNSAWDALLR